jgi:hypothetical protein
MSFIRGVKLQVCYPKSEIYWSLCALLKGIAQLFYR